MDVIPFSRPTLTGNEKRYVDEALDAGWISGTGSFVPRFEEALSAKIGRKRCIAVANGTLALEVALQALGIKAGDEIIVPALTFVAPAACVRRLGACPVLADIDPVSWTLDPESVRRCITRNTKAIIAVDLVGNPCNYDALAQFELPIIEDAAEAHGASYHDKLTGSFGLVSTFSFHANKNISTGEGGAILTDWDWLANRMRLIMAHGMDRPYYHSVVGTNARPSNLTCALGLAQVENWDSHLRERNRVANLYLAHLPISAGAVALHHQSQTWMVTIMHDRRDQILAALKENAVDARAIFVPLHQLPLYAPYGVLKDYPVADQIGRTALMLPTFEGMTENQVERVTNVILGAI